MNVQEIKKTPRPRYCGILVHPTSFPSPYGIGDLGDGAYAFIDFLYDAGGWPTALSETMGTAATGGWPTASSGSMGTAAAGAGPTALQGIMGNCGKK